jgi:purine-binding chemotaxis protein CheW
MNEPNHTVSDQFVIFTLDEQSFALPLRSVVKVIQAIEVRYLPKAPDIIAGIINIKGLILPVADIRKRFGLAVHEIGPDDQIIIADTGKRKIAITVDNVNSVRNLTPDQLFAGKDTLPFAEHLSGVAKVDDGLVLIYDLDNFLSLDEQMILDKAMNSKKNE